MTSETKLLKPRDPELVDSNSWPILTLTQVEVLDEATNAPCSLLSADADKTLKIQGRLGRSRENNKQLLNPDIRSLPTQIIVEHIPTFSYGQDAEGTVLLWAAGQSGWFEITPAKSYEAEFKSDCEAVSILYFLADLYEEFKATRAPLRKLAVESVFEAYAKAPAHKCSTAGQAEAAIQRHREFLLKSMQKGKEGITWKQTALLAYLQQSKVVMATASKARDGVQTPEKSLKDDPRSRHAGKGRSSLRPKALNHAGKGTSGLQDENEADEPPIPHMPRASSPLKRKRGADESQGPSVKDEDSESATFSAPLFPPKTINAPKPSKVKRERASVPDIPPEALPDMRVNGYGDIWTCTVDGCGSRVYSASLTESKVLIKRHFQSHVHEQQMQMDIVYREQRPYLPVGHLASKIQALQQASAGLNDATPGGLVGLFPAPIKRKY